MVSLKKALLVVHRFWPHPGGSERLFYNIARRLADRGYEITVFTTNAWHPESYHKPWKERLGVGIQEHEGLTIRRFEIRNIPLQFKVLRAVSILPVDEISLLSGSPYVLLPGYLREIFVARPRFDLIIAGVLPHSHLLYPSAWLARHYRIPWVCIPLIHTGITGGRPSPGYLTGPQVRLMKRADAILTATRAENHALEVRGFNPAKLHCVGIGVDPDEIVGGQASRFRESFNVGGPMVLQISTLTRAKGAFDLVEAMKLLWASGTDAKLVLIGAPMDDFKDYFASQPPHVHERTLYLGFVDEPTKKDALAACDVFVMASSADSFGTVYLEAWLHCKPVVGADAGGVPYLVSHNQDGLLVKFSHPRELADSISRLLADEELRTSMGEKGRRKVLNNYTWDAVLNRIGDVIEPLLAG
jgi:glycosyltransferase involved in cell wall biosynthesis